MKKPMARVGAQVPKEILEKFCYIAARECRSTSGMIRVLVRAYVADFEREHGSIGQTGQEDP